MKNTCKGKKLHLEYKIKKTITYTACSSIAFNYFITRRGEQNISS